MLELKLLYGVCITTKKLPFFCQPEVLFLASRSSLAIVRVLSKELGKGDQHRSDLRLSESPTKNKVASCLVLRPSSQEKALKVLIYFSSGVRPCLRDINQRKDNSFGWLVITQDVKCL